MLVHVHVIYLSIIAVLIVVILWQSMRLKHISEKPATEVQFIAREELKRIMEDLKLPEQNYMLMTQLTRERLKLRQAYEEFGDLVFFRKISSEEQEIYKERLEKCLQSAKDACAKDKEDEDAAALLAFYSELLNKLKLMWRIDK